MKRAFLLLNFLLCSITLADRTEHSPVIFGSGSSLKINPGVPLLGTWDFSSATVLGLPSVTTGDLTDVGTDGITVTGGTDAVVGSGTSLSQHVADTSHSGYLSSADWIRLDVAYSDRLKWDGGATGLTAATGRTSLGATTIGSNIFTLTNPSAITFLRINADNTVDARSAANFRSDIGAGTSNVTTFTALSDVPASYSSQSLKAVRVNAGETALEFYTPAATTQIGGPTFSLKRTSGVPTGKFAGYWTAKYSGTITGWDITADAGTITIKVWKKAAGTAKPTSADSINTSGVSLSTGTHINSNTVSDFTTTAVTAGDVFAVEVTTVSGVFDVGGSIQITH
jgi:hypothetical protein